MNQLITSKPTPPHQQKKKKRSRKEEGTEQTGEAGIETQIENHKLYLLYKSNAMCSRTNKING